MASAQSNPARVDTVEVLRSLLAAEHCGAVHFLAASDPYVSRAHAAVRRMLQSVVQANMRHERELAMLVEDLGQVPPLPRVNAEHQYMAFLSSDYLLPKVRDDVARSIRAYEAALKQLEAGDEAAVGTLLSHLDEHRRDLEALDKAIEARKGNSATGPAKHGPTGAAGSPRISP